MDIDGELLPAVAMPGAVAEGKNFDVTKVYDDNDPIAQRSYVSEAASAISYSTMLTSRSEDTLLVEYEWYVTFENEPLIRLDRDEFVINVSFYDIEREELIIPDQDNRFELAPIGDTKIVEIAVSVDMYFAKVDKLMDPRFKDSVFWVTVDVQRVLELKRYGNLEIKFDTNDSEVDGELYPGEDPIIYIKDFAYTGTSSYTAYARWEIIHDYELKPQDLYVVNITFINKSTFEEILPDANGRYTFPAKRDIRMRIEISFVENLAYMQANYPEMLNSKHTVTVQISND